MLSRALKTAIPIGPTSPPTDMHQVASPTLTPRKKRFRRNRYIIFGAIGLLLL